MSSYVVGTDAAFDFDDIWDYIASDSIDAADHWIAKLFDTLSLCGGLSSEFGLNLGTSHGNNGQHGACGFAFTRRPNPARFEKLWR